MKTSSIIGGIVALGLNATAHAQSADPAASAHGFVDRFYAWYVPLIVSPKGAPGWDIVLTKARTDLSPELNLALKADSDASKKNANEVVGLDFDPFLNSQDPCQHYTVGKAAMGKGVFDVEIRCVGSKDKQPDLIAEVAQRNGQWMFVNFVYPGNGDLLKVLKQLAEERAKPSH